MCYTSELKSPARPFPKYSVREGIAVIPTSDMKSIINVDFVEEPRSNGMERLSKLYDVLGKLSRHQYNE